MTAPTEAELRAVIVEGMASKNVGQHLDSQDGTANNLQYVVNGAAWAFIESAASTKEGDGVWEPSPEPTPGTVWTDLRPSEADRLVVLIGAAAERVAERCQAIILGELTAVGVKFAREFPDAPRGPAFT